MTSFGISELIVIGIVLLVFVGPERMPHVVRTVGRAYGRMRRAAEDLRRALVLEADRLDEEERLKELKRRREEAAEERKKAEKDGALSQPPRAVASTPAAPTAEHVPTGFTEAEWQELPAHVRELILRREVVGGEQA